MLQRILALIVKELISLWKDPKTRYVLIIPPLIQVLLFANAANYDVSHARIAIWNDDQGRHSTELIRRFADSNAFRPVAIVASPDAAQRAIDTKDAAAVLRFGQTFSADVEAGRPASVQLLLDTRRSNTALMIDGYASDIVATYAASLRPGGSVPLVVETRNWFNPTLDSRWFVLPGLVAVLPFLMAMLVSALSLAREREFGTFEQMLVTPLGPLEIMIGKAVPAIIVGWIEANMVLAAAVLWFGVPFEGSLLLLESALLVYMLAGVSIGLAISASPAPSSRAFWASSCMRRRRPCCRASPRRSKYAAGLRVAEPARPDPLHDRALPRRLPAGHAVRDRAPSDLADGADRPRPPHHRHRRGAPGAGAVMAGSGPIALR